MAKDNAIDISEQHREIADKQRASFVLAESDLKEQVAEFETMVAALPQAYVEPQHDIMGGMYARTGLIPAGMVFTGKVHKKDHINIVFGDITILSDDGPVRLTGYHVLPTKAGSKRVAFTHADTIWTTIHATMLTDVEAIEDEVVEDSENLQTRKPKKDEPCISQ